MEGIDKIFQIEVIYFRQMLPIIRTLGFGIRPDEVPILAVGSVNLDNAYFT